MSERPSPKPEDMPRLLPYLLCEDVAAEVEFLGKAFGFEESRGERVQPDPNGPIQHTEARFLETVVLMGHPGPSYQNPNSLDARTVLLYVYVDDVDAHCERARAAGATITEEVAETPYGDRRYAARDPEGHEWYFASRVRIVEPGGGGA